MAATYEPIARVFSPIVDIDALSDGEVAQFFKEAFSSVGMTVRGSGCGNGNVSKHSDAA